MEFPEELFYTRDHEWLRLEENDEALIGITAFAAAELGDIVYVDINSGQTLRAGETFGTIEAVKTVSDLFSPATGTLLTVNPELDTQPELVNSDPYGRGWLVRIRISEPTAPGTLLSPEQYQKLTGHGN